MKEFSIHKITTILLNNQGLYYEIWHGRHEISGLGR